MKLPAGGSGWHFGWQWRHLIDYYECVTDCKAVDAGSIPTPASKNQVVSDIFLMPEWRKYFRHGVPNSLLSKQSTADFWEDLAIPMAYGDGMAG